MWFGIITLFPEMFSTLDSGVTGRALKEKRVHVTCWNPRDFTKNKHQNVDDRPYGGGPGMVMMAEPLRDAIQAAKKAAPKPPLVIHLSPQGKRFDQEAARMMLQREDVILIAGRYEGIDERLLASEADEEWSIGDYVLSGGELAAMVMVDAITRLIPGVLGNEQSAKEDSFGSGLLEYPQYTRPEMFEGAAIPDVLMSGNHALIERWRLKQSLGRTWQKRPDLLAKRPLTEREQALLTEFKKEMEKK